MTPGQATRGLAVKCAAMTAATRADARHLLERFLAGDAHYRASATAYGDAGPARSIARSTRSVSRAFCEARARGRLESATALRRIEGARP